VPAVSVSGLGIRDQCDSTRDEVRAIQSRVPSASAVSGTRSVSIISYVH
jgi:hypothetical protein